MGVSVWQTSLRSHCDSGCFPKASTVPIGTHPDALEMPNRPNGDEQFDSRGSQLQDAFMFPVTRTCLWKLQTNPLKSLQRMRAKTALCPSLPLGHGELVL